MNPTQRLLAPHVAKAIGTGASRSAMGALQRQTVPGFAAPAGRVLAPHVAAAIGVAQARLAASSPASRPVAAHLAVAGGCRAPGGLLQPRWAVPAVGGAMRASKAVIQRATNNGTTSTSNTELSDEQELQIARYMSLGMDYQDAFAAVVEPPPKVHAKKTGKVRLTRPGAVRVAQGESGWCYAATALGFAQYLGSASTTTVWQVVAAVKKKTDLKESEIRAQFGADFGQEEHALRALGVGFRNELGLNLDLIEANLRADKPVILAWGGHSRVVTGINFDGAYGPELETWDPKDKETQEIQIGIVDDSQAEIYL